jgi:hypothetical protein
LPGSVAPFLMTAIVAVLSFTQKPRETVLERNLERNSGRLV